MATIDSLIEDIETVTPPPRKALALAPLIDGWWFQTNGDVVWLMGDLDGKPVRSAALIAVDRAMRWAATSVGVWRLGSHAGSVEQALVSFVTSKLDDLADTQPKEDPRPGIVVLPKVGGTSMTTAAREAHAEFKAIAGVKLPLVPVPDLPSTRRTLIGEFPHAIGVIDRMLGDLSGRATIRFVPTLLVGPAGCGKSRVARRIGEVCGIHVGSYDGAGAADSSFGGTSRRWSSGEPAKPLSVIKDCMQGNPLILLDEIDKCGVGRQNGNLINSILTVIEVETAKRFADPYVDAAVDLSHISFVLTANDDTVLPVTLKDRCRILRMPPITAEHVPALVGAIVADLAAERGIDRRWVPALDGDEIEIARRLLGDGSIRRLRSIIERLLVQRETRAMRH